MTEKEKLRKDIQLVKDCIKHKWEPIVYQGKEDKGSDDCALCKKYRSDYCVGCPIKERRVECWRPGQPYYIWSMYFSPWYLESGRRKIRRIVYDKISGELAKKMLNLLYDLCSELQDELERIIRTERRRRKIEEELHKLHCEEARRFSEVMEKEKLEKDLALVEKSIVDKWRSIVYFHGVDRGVRNCPLCQEYLVQFGTCENCPIAKYQIDCSNPQSSYSQWRKFFGEGALRVVRGERTRKAARNMLDSLESLYHLLRDKLEKFDTINTQTLIITTTFFKEKRQLINDLLNALSRTAISTRINRKEEE